MTTLNEIFEADDAAEAKAEKYQRASDAIIACKAEIKAQRESPSPAGLQRISRLAEDAFRLFDEYALGKVA